MSRVKSARCPSCSAKITAENIAELEVDTEITGDQTWFRGMYVCPECGVILGSYSDYRRTDITEGTADSWERVRGIDE